MNPRFPARGSSEYYTYLEDWLLKERVDNERQWRLLRQCNNLLTGLNPILPIIPDPIQSGEGSGSGSGTGSVSLPPTARFGACCFYNGGFWQCVDNISEANCRLFHIDPGGEPDPCWNETIDGTPTCANYSAGIDCGHCSGSGSGSGNGSGSGTNSGSGCCGGFVSFNFPGMTNAACALNPANSTGGVVLFSNGSCSYEGFSLIGTSGVSRIDCSLTGAIGVGAGLTCRFIFCGIGANYLATGFNCSGTVFTIDSVFGPTTLAEWPPTLTLN